jgi:hypothetical protein
VRCFGERGLVIVAHDEHELPGKIEHAMTLGGTDRIDTQASPRLLATIRAFLDGDPCQLDSSVSVEQNSPPAIGPVTHSRQSVGAR